MDKNVTFQIVCFMSLRKERITDFLFFAKCKKEEANFSHFAIMLILTWKMKIFQFFCTLPHWKNRIAKIFRSFESFFGILAYLRYFQIVMRTETSDLRTKSGRSSLFPLQGHSVLPKGSEMSPDSEKDDLWIRWSVLSFRMRNAPRKLRVIYCLLF